MTGQSILTNSGMVSVRILILLFWYREYISRRACNSKTKMIIINTPHNPVGKVFSREELEKIAEVSKEFNLIVMSD